jgi:CHAD domain-containing protein
MRGMNDLSQTVEAGHEQQVVDVALATLDDRLKSVRKRFSQAARRGATNPERIHQLRVATRRASAAIDFYEDFITRKSANKMAQCLKRIRSRAGKVRDCDLLLARFSGEEAQAEASSFIKRAQASRASAFRDFRRLHRQHDDSNRLKRRARKLLAKTRRKAERRPHLAVQKFKDWAPGRLRVFVSEFFQAANPDLRDFTQLHQFRIRSKALRYAMELVDSTFPPSFRAELYPVVERLQSLLGDINDEANFIRSVGRRLTNQAKLPDIDGLKHRMAQEQRTLDELEREFSQWWTADRRDALQRGFEAVIIQRST